MEIKIKLSGSLLLIYKNLEECITVHIDEPISIEYLLHKTGIHPFVAPMVLVDGDVKDKDFIIEKEVELTVIGPLAGG
ncbi:hypothetical protein QBE52_16770 [Clostridiaceae bacterium 35-E11]